MDRRKAHPQMASQLEAIQCLLRPLVGDEFVDGREVRARIEPLMVLPDEVQVAEAAEDPAGRLDGVGGESPLNVFERDRGLPIRFRDMLALPWQEPQVQIEGREDGVLSLVELEELLESVDCLRLAGTCEPVPACGAELVADAGKPSTYISEERLILELRPARHLKQSLHQKSRSLLCGSHLLTTLIVVLEIRATPARLGSSTSDESSSAGNSE